MGLIRGLIHGVLDEVKPHAVQPAQPASGEGYGTQAYGATEQGYGYEPQPPQQAQDATGRHHRRSTDDGDSPKQGRGEKFKVAFAMVKDANVRRRRALNLTHILAYTLVIVSIIFLCLVLWGDYPQPKDQLQALGTYNLYVAKQAVILGAAILGIAGVLTANKALRSGGSLVLPEALLVVSILCPVATVGMGIYLMTKGGEMDYSWWTYLFSVLTLIQRILYILVASMAVYTLREAGMDHSVAEEVAEAQGVGPAHAADKGGMYNGASYNAV